MEAGRFANIIIEISHEKVDRPFQYMIPESLMDEIHIGDCVEVPFGSGNKLKKGYVISITDKNEYPVEKLKSVYRILKDQVGVEADSIKLAGFIRRNYGSTMIAALKTVLPVKKTVKLKETKTIQRKMTSEEVFSLYAQAVSKKQKAKERILKELIEEEILPYDLVYEKLHVTMNTLNSLARDGVITIEHNSYYRNPVKLNLNAEAGHSLSMEQTNICRQVIEDFDNGINANNGGLYLIYGITGSGKTEVYIKLIKDMIARGKQCIVLIPEIALTYQTLIRFYKVFGDRVSVINSSLSQGERYDQCLRAQNGEIDIIIGPRSALFVPFKDLGLVIIDEEHESSYISEQNPRYHAKETAEELCRIKGASLVLGSATPSIDSYYEAKNGRYKLFKLTKRLTGGELPMVDIVDLREELTAGNRSMFSRTLQDKMKERLDKGEQTILFLNRRGYSGFISCRSCGEVIKCPHCDVSLSRHNNGKLICHYCGYETMDIKQCPSCGSKYISGFKVGTQQVEEAINKMYPEARVLRMDADTTREKDSYEKILGAFSEGEADILIGTQMIVKGHDFPNVTLVGVLLADISLNETDYKSAERTFQLLTQAVGRAGRGTKMGEALIQTYRPEHYSIVLSAKQDYEGMYEEEIAYRIVGDYPPAGMLMHILVQSKNDRRALGLATAMGKRVTKGVRCIGPAPSAVSRINDYYRYSLYLKAANADIMNECREVLENYLETAPLAGELVSFEIL